MQGDPRDDTGEDGRQVLQAALHDTQARLEEHYAARRRAEAELAEARRGREAAEAELAAIRASRSWRLARWLARLRPGRR